MFSGSIDFMLFHEQGRLAMHKSLLYILCNKMSNDDGINDTCNASRHHVLLTLVSVKNAVTWILFIFCRNQNL